MPPRALITGCSSGFGRELVTELLSRGWQVIATLRRLDERRPEFAVDLERYPGKLTLIDLELNCSESRAAATATILALEGSLDAFISNAGYGLFGPLAEISEAQWREQLEVNVTSAVLMTRALLPKLIESKAVVVYLSSIMGVWGQPLATAYCASKFALEGFAEALHYELGPHGVRVHLVEPGGHRTDFGRKLQWGAERGETFELERRNHERFLESMLKKEGKSPRAVTELVIRLLSSNSRRLRHFVGRDAQVIRMVQSLFPQWLKGPLWRKAFAKIFRKPLATSP